MQNRRPVVLSFSGHDPSGGAGIQADIEALISHQCHACSVITALTEQDSSNVKKLIPQKPQDIIEQARTLCADFPIAAIKIGLLGHHESVAAIRTVLLEHEHIPVVLDPVLAAGGGAQLATEQLIDSINELLLPLSTVLTPNSDEARILAKQQDLSACGRHLQSQGAEFVLVTGADERSEQVHNRLFMASQQEETFTWQRLPENYHGSGCTLASAIAALLAHGLDPFTAVVEAQEYTWNALQAAYRPGRGQFNPNRLFWVEDQA
ncbi:hydroxymethylpyrimidine/phosphomethylpyrimidine kinase [Methylomarinum sp. Ch1-1]|uniref:hydroxymethylpyrimidine kinase n=1 Tax=Methylomarinum roseum TaxID=3067653 RepID=A0AAU7NPX7_9GAMM|nr:hydroxymethylpyrimidine/phosphomethylpyrimidine kinase [Methylomarinum sp. Ch1-1]MDP4521060.1 hydroxymethylpyrimidine/phosphomethylpyrimidine kinase [Methylomarinum sp. Ch1-1]